MKPFIILFTLTVGFFTPLTAAEKPNILLIMVDDMGWSDIGCYGGELDTPHIDSLAKDGLRFTSFYNNAVCGATRASLLSGLYSQQTGHRGDRWNEPKDFSKCVLISEVLQANGYHTAMVGKWQGRDLAVKRGFDRFFGPMCQGKISYWNAVKDNDFYLDDKPWKYTKDFFLTETFNDFSVEFLKDAVKKDKPFFLYAAYVAPHWPLHARDRDIEPYRERYLNKGWDDWTSERHQRQRELGLLPENWTPAAKDKSVPDWSEDKNKKWQAERMAVYAAQITKVDQGVGRLLKVLKDSGADKNTLVLFLSDNGAASNGGINPSKNGFGFPAKKSGSWRKDGGTIKGGSGPDHMPGPAGTFAGYGIAWAGTSNAPFRGYKQSAYEGGIRTPLIARWPDVITEGGKFTRQPGHVMDIMATALDIAGIEYPKEFQGRHPLAMEGKSLLPVFRGEPREGHKRLAWNSNYSRSIRMGDWKLVKAKGKTHNNAKWELYNLKQDGGETKNLAGEDSNRVKKMISAYEAWQKRVGAQ
ncbi:MAG: arylsulfatase [Verrucomicrobia bacterium]|nr:arylsulfatase [Verrucomicrobiota bacterium]